MARAAKLRRLQVSLARGRGHDGDQHAVWRDVDRYLTGTGAASESAAFEDGFRHRRRHADSMLMSFEPTPDQVGIAAVCGASIVGLDVFGSPSLYARGWRKVGRGLMAEVYDEHDAPTEDDALGIVRAALQTIATCERHALPRRASDRHCTPAPRTSRLAA
jgi:hypothetical protein